MVWFGKAEGKELRFDLTDMRLFLTVVEQGSLTKGAESMNLALASVSERISGTESSLGAQLLERNRRGVTTTAAGDALIRHARLILDQVEQMENCVPTALAWKGASGSCPTRLGWLLFLTTGSALRRRDAPAGFASAQTACAIAGSKDRAVCAPSHR